ncbi:hypothetical protein ACRALDRAFT_206591 [Sodiomyces alcalophilus JCM 7366]|uniref:uncharacterized protein n=1 Tax=Sodiomyces alcalophilus JCM 7366 TaxID=591952 RepID=UPI0039B4032A
MHFVPTDTTRLRKSRVSGDQFPVPGTEVASHILAARLRRTISSRGLTTSLWQMADETKLSSYCTCTTVYPGGLEADV